MASRWLSLLLMLGLPLAGLAPRAAQAQQRDLMVLAAASLRQPLEAIARRFEALHPGVRVALIFGASNVLARQIEAGAPADLFASADEHLLDSLAAQGLEAPGSRLVLAGNRLAVVATPQAAPSIKSAGDLLGQGIRRIALPDASVPVGRYAREWLDQHGIRAEVEARAVRSEDARAALAAVDAGHADAAIAYATDARIARSAKLAFQIPAAEQPRIVYAASAIASSKNGRLARELLLFLGGEEASRAMREAGFTAPPESP
jgi:molybdate transport system substrate-binding protein